MPARTLKIDDLFPTIAVRLAKPLRIPGQAAFATAGEVVRVQGRAVDNDEGNADVAIIRGDDHFAIGRLSELAGAVLVDVPDGPIEPRELACRAFRDLVKRGDAGFDAYDPAIFVVGDVTVAGRTPPGIAKDLDDRLIYLNRAIVERQGLAYRFMVVDGELGAFVTDDLRLKLAEIGDYQIDTALASRAAR